MAARRILMLGAGILFATAASGATDLQVIPDAYRQIAAAERVPAESLYSLAMAESTRKTAWGAKPWPWTINVAGRGYHYSTREEAFTALLGFMQRWPLKNIDVGVAQVNLGWNGHFSRRTVMRLIRTPIFAQRPVSCGPAMTPAPAAGFVRRAATTIRQAVHTRQPIWPLCDASSVR